MFVKNLFFRHSKQAPYFFKNLSFDLEEGLLHALHGKNGVGKSVLLHILSEQMGPEALWSGEIVSKKAVLMNQQFDEALAKQFTFLENMQFGSLRRFPSPFSRLPLLSMEKQFLPFLKHFRIDVTLPVCRLSGGQRQILALLLQLQKGTQVLLLDEPTAALDEENAILVFEFLKTLKGVTLLVVCHDQELIGRYATGKQLRMEIDSEGVRVLK